MKKALLKALIMALAVMLVLPVIPVAAAEEHEGYYSLKFECDEGVEAITTHEGAPIEESKLIVKFEGDDTLYVSDKWNVYGFDCPPYIEFCVKLKDGYEISELKAQAVNKLFGPREYECCTEVSLFYCPVYGDVTFAVKTRKTPDEPTPVQKPLSKSELTDIYTPIAAAAKQKLRDFGEDLSFRHGEKVNSVLAIETFEYSGYAEYENFGGGIAGLGTHYFIPLSYVQEKLSKTFVNYDISDAIDKYISKADIPTRDDQISTGCAFLTEAEWKHGTFAVDNYDVYADASGRAAKIAVQGIERCYAAFLDVPPEETEVLSVDELVLVYDTESGNWKIDEYYPLDFTLEDNKPIYQSEVTGTPYDSESILIDDNSNVAFDCPEDDAEYYEGAVFGAEPLTESELFDTAKDSVGAEYENFIPYSFTLKDASGKSLPLKGKVTVSVPVPEGWNAMDTLVFFVGEDGKAQAVTATASEDGKYIIFETDHFSVWVLANASTKIDTPTTDDTTPGTGDVEPPKTSTPMTVAVWFAVMLLTVVCGTTVYATIKRRRSAK